MHLLLAVTSLLRSLLFPFLVYLCKKSVLLLLYNPKLSFFIKPLLLFSDWKSCKLHQIYGQWHIHYGRQNEFCRVSVRRGLLVYADSIIINFCLECYCSVIVSVFPFAMYITCNFIVMCYAWSGFQPGLVVVVVVELSALSGNVDECALYRGVWRHASQAPLIPYL